MTDLTLVGALIAGFLSVFFVVYLILSMSEGRRPQVRGRLGIFAGMVALLLGVMVVGFWVYFLINGRESLSRSLSEYIIHVGLELLSGLTLVIAGVAMLRAWARGPALLMISVGVLIFVTILSLYTYGPRGHPFLMNGIAVLMTIVFAYFVGMVYAWEHFVLRLDTSDREAKENIDRTNVA